MTNYTGRKIAIFTDIHGLLIPTIAIINDIKNKNIKEIYSLGDNIGLGPNPSQVLDLLNENNVKIINGNNEDYVILGIEPFLCYFTDKKIENNEWTKYHLTSEQINKLKENKYSYDLIVGGKKIGLCHFANDVRIDFTFNNTWTYQNSIKKGIKNAQEQFYYTNSETQKQIIEQKSKIIIPKNKGYISAKNNPLFDGKMINYYDEIIQGHVHFKLITEDEKTKVRTIRAVAMAYDNDPIDYASYIIIKEKQIGYDIEEVLVPFNRELMIKNIDNSGIPDKEPIKKYILKR